VPLPQAVNSIEHISMAASAASQPIGIQDT